MRVQGIKQYLHVNIKNDLSVRKKHAVRVFMKFEIWGTVEAYLRWC